VHEHARLHVQAAGFPCVLCVGGVAERAQLDAFANPHPRRRPRVVVGTPGRIKDFRDRGVFSTDRVVFQVLDEADRLLDGGFERDVEEVAVPPGGACATVCLSATMPPKLERFLRRRLPPDHAHVVIGGPMGGNVGGSVEHVTCACRPEETVAAVMDAVDAYAARRGGREEEDAEKAEKAEKNILGGKKKVTRDPENEDETLPGSSGRAIVFAETKVAAERLSTQLAVAYEVRRPSPAFPFRFVPEKRRSMSALSSSRPKRVSRETKDYNSARPSRDAGKSLRRPRGDESSTSTRCLGRGRSRPPDPGSA
jgi:superfamily II DNA/RNA helicase